MPWSLYDSYQKIADYIDGALSYHRDTVNDFEQAAEIASQNFGVDDGAFNSFTHAYVSALVAYEGDPQTSAFVGYLREAKVVLLGYDDKDLDTWKDLYNNKVGIQIAEYGIQNGLSFEQVTSLVAAAAGSGTIIVDPYDTPILEPWQFPLSGAEPQINFEELTSLAFPNDTLPVLSISSEVASEGETLYFKVSIEGGAVNHDITFQATTFQGSTTDFNSDGSSPDYYGVNGTWAIEAGEPHILIPVQTDEDNVHEGTETLELHVTAIEGASNETLVATGTILDDDPDHPSFEMDSFTLTTDTGEIDVEYTISHDGDQDLTGVRAEFWLSQDGTLENATYVGYESSGTLSVGEQDWESEWLDTSGYFGEWQLITTVEADGLEQFIQRTDTVDLGDEQFINLSLEDVSLNTTAFGDGETDLKSYFTVVNSGNMSTYGMTEGTGIFWSADAVFDAGDIRIDYDSHGTLEAGEHDSEYERTYAEDLGFDQDGFIFLVVDPDNVIAESDETDNVSGPIAVTFDAPHDGPDIDLSLEDITFRDDNVLVDGEDVRADFVVVNSGSESTAGMNETTGVFWSEDDHFDFLEDTLIDYDTHGTLYAGEHDAEYERTHYEDIPQGWGYLFYVVDPLNVIAETDETNNVSDPYLFLVA